jgi:hypothetical protein
VLEAHQRLRCRQQLDRYRRHRAAVEAVEEAVVHGYLDLAVKP